MPTTTWYGKFTMSDTHPMWNDEFLPQTQEDIPECVDYKDNHCSFQVNIKKTLSTYDSGTIQLQDRIKAKNHVSENCATFAKSYVLATIF